MKMDHLTALCLPDTVPSFESAAPLLLLFEQLVHYRPTEHDSPETAPLFTGSDLLASYAPAPLGDDLDRFLSMVRDLRGHADQYAGNFLSSLSPAMAQSYQEESVQQLIGALTGGASPPAETSPRDENFWRTRLLLQLAEEMRRDEVEITNRLAGINDKQQQMLQALRDDDEGITPPASPAAPFPRLPIRDDLLVHAWCRLYLADHHDQRPDIPASANSEAAELFFDAYSRHTGRETTTIASLPLPSLTGMSETDYLARRTAFRQAAAGCLDKLAQTITAAAQSGDTTVSEELGRQWQEALAEHFPEVATTAQLKITLLANVSFAELCRRLGKSDEQEIGQALPHTVLVHVAPFF